MFNISKSDRTDFCEEIIESSAPRSDYYFLVILSTLIVAFGLVNNNMILVIGGMLVTPLLSPILAISLGIVITNLKVTLRSIRIFVISFLLAVLVSYIIGVISGSDMNHNDYVGQIMKPSAVSFLVAIIAGMAASFTWAKPELNKTLPGVAITVTLIPPMTALGIALADKDKEIFMDALNVIMLNVAGILLASSLIFLLMKFYKAERKILAEIKEEEKEFNNN